MSAPTDKTPSGGPGQTVILDRPQVTPAEQWSFPEATRGQGANGLTVLSYDAPGQYVVSVRLAIPLPLSAEPRELEGIGTIMSRTLDEGTARHSAEEFAELLERKGIALGAAVNESGLTIEVDVPKRHLSYALDLLSQAVREPAFPENEVSRHVKTRLAEIEQERAIPGQRAALAFVEAYFHADERASRPTAGTPDTVVAITPADLRAFHGANVGPMGATLVIAGDLSLIDVAAEVDAALGSWDVATPSPLESAAAVRADDASRVVFVDRPGSVQTELYVGCPGPDRHVEGGWAPYPVLGFVVGGSPNARIDAVLREQRGFTYGIRSGFRPRHRGGLFLTTGSVRADSTAEGLGLLLDILDTALDGFTAEETRAGVDFIGKTAPGRYATADALADEAAALSLEGLTTEFTTANLRDLASLDPARLADAYRRFVSGEWTVVVVGDASEYAEGVRALGRGEVTVIPS